MRQVFPNDKKRQRQRYISSVHTREVGQGALGRAHAAATHQHNVAALTDGRVGLEDRVVEVLKAVVAARTAARPLQQDRHVRVGVGDRKHRADALLQVTVWFARVRGMRLGFEDIYRPTCMVSVVQSDQCA